MSSGVSVIVTVYKRLDFLREALESVITQTNRPREIIVADDSSTDAARSICEPFATKSQIQYRANPSTLGIAASVRCAIAAANGEFISVLNDDDVWENNFLSELVPPLQQDRRRVLAFSDHWIISEDGSIDPEETDHNTSRYGRVRLPEGDVADVENILLVQRSVPMAMASLFRKDAIDLSLITDEVSNWYDLWIGCMLAASGGKFYYVPTRLTRYRVHSRSETARRSPDRCANQVYFFSQLLDRNWFPNSRAFLQWSLAGTIFLLGRDKLYFNQADEARQCFLKSLQTQFNWRSMAALLLSYLPRFLRVRLRLSSAS